MGHARQEKSLTIEKMQLMRERDLNRVQQVADYFDVSASHVYKQISQGRIPKYGDRIRLSDYEAMLIEDEEEA